MPFVIFINIITKIFKYVLKFINYTGLLVIIINIYCNIIFNYCYIKRKLEDENNLDYSNTKRKLNQDNSESELESEQKLNSELEQESNSEVESELDSELDSDARAELGSELDSESESESESGLDSKDSESCPDLGHSGNETEEEDLGLISEPDDSSHRE